jgi:hypothetical protein
MRPTLGTLIGMRRLATLAVGMALLPLFAMGQQARQRSTQRYTYPKELAFPEKPTPYQWHWDQERHKIWVFKQGQWEPFPCTDCRLLKSCNGHYIVRDRYHYIVARYDGSIVAARSPQVRCLEGFILIDNDQRMRSILNAESDTVATVVSNCVIYTDTIRGEQVFCFPQYQPGLERFNCGSLRNWGMMNAQGQWLIQPDYDKPFRFEGGEAAVVLKGRHFRIDEQGREVPDAADGQ